MLTYGLPAIFLVMLVKEAGLPIPIPGDVLMLGAAARAASGQWSISAVIFTFVTAMIMGGTVQYLLARGPGRQIVYRLGRYIGLTPNRLERAAATLHRGGVVAVTLGLCTPGVRAVTIAASGVADIPFRTFFPALVLGDSIFFLLHLALGYAGGRGLKALLQGHHPAFDPVLLLILAAVLLIGCAGWLVLRRRALSLGHPAPSIARVTGAWEEACCPACLLLGAIHPTLNESA